MCYMLCATCYMSRLDSVSIDLYIDGTLLSEIVRASGGIGIRVGLRSQCPKGLVGSSPTLRTNLVSKGYRVFYLLTQQSFSLADQSFFQPIHLFGRLIV